VKVLTITPWWPRDQEDQEGSFIRDQVDSLRAAGVQVDVVAVSKDLARRPGTVETVRFRWLPRYVAHGFEARLLTARLRSTGVLASDGYDLVHAHGDSCGIACSRLVRNVPLVVTVHGITTHARARRSVLWRADLESMASRSRVVVVGNPLLKEPWVVKGRPTVVHNGYDSRRFSFSSIPAFPPLRVVSVSNLYRSKGVHITVQAIARARSMGIPVELNIVGDGPER
jgi:glycosyltransferase involved in cell wall biosynthesis